MSHHSFTQVSCGTVEGHGNGYRKPKGESTETGVNPSEYQVSPAGIESGLSTFMVLGAQCETGRSKAIDRTVGLHGPVILGVRESYPANSAFPTAPRIHFVKRFSSSSGLKSRNHKNSLNFFSNSGVSWRSLLFGRIATYWAELMRRTLAPLRKIVARELEVFELRRNSVHPQSFAVHDRLECGHVHTSLLWDIFDLLSGYTTNPEVSAKRHRCRACAQLLATKKPVASAALIAKSGAA